MYVFYWLRQIVIKSIQHNIREKNRNYNNNQLKLTYKVNEFVQHIIIHIISYWSVFRVWCIAFSLLD